MARTELPICSRDISSNLWGPQQRPHSNRRIALNWKNLQTFLFLSISGAVDIFNLPILAAHADKILRWRAHLLMLRNELQLSATLPVRC